MVTKQKGYFGGLNRQSQFIAEDADDAASESENGGDEQKALGRNQGLNLQKIMIINLLGGIKNERALR